MLEGNQPIVQEFTADGSVLSNIKIRVFTKPGTEPSSLFVALKDKETGEILYEKDDDTYGIKENTALYSFLKKEIPVQKGRTYELELRSDAGVGEGIGLYCVTDKKGTEILTQASEPETGTVPAGSRSLQMCVSGVQ